MTSSTTVATAETSREPRQTSRFEKKKNTVRRYPVPRTPRRLLAARAAFGAANGRETLTAKPEPDDA